MRTADIRQRWLDYFSQRDHAVVPSASLVSPDPSLLFTVAGMVPFIPYMLGQQTPPWKRATSVQKCVRTLDIEEVGRTTRHGTFFQMNGNFSFGDYFKAEAITYAWDLVTGSEAEGKYGFDPDTIWVTVFEDDDEAAQLWREVAGLPDERIQRRGRADNFWHTGQPGPAGPCSEIYVDRGPEYGAEGGPIVDEDRYLEIWNLVFMQYAIDEVRSKEEFRIVQELKQRNIDTGLGLERVAYLKQGKDNMYEIDEVFPVIEAAQEMSGKTYGGGGEDDVRMRVVADHVRSSLMLIGDGITPANEGRGYVLRRLLRRSVNAMRLLGVNEPALPVLLPRSLEAMQSSYPELAQDWSRISQVAYTEEDAFRRTLNAGASILDVAVQQAKQRGAEQKASRATVSGEDAFALHDTYGFPIDLTLEIAAEQGVVVDEASFRELMQQQRERARADAMAKRGGHANTAAYEEVAKDLPSPVEFVGYTDAAAQVRVAGLIVDGQPVPTVSAPAQVEVILDRTPFYAEAGGQLADHGSITLTNGAHLEVDDVQSPIKGIRVHFARLIEGTISLDDTGNAVIDGERRHAVSKAHSATHMIHKALRETLGDNATQAGSENAPFRVRFDFRNPVGLGDGALQEVEERVNSRLVENLEVTEVITSLDEARAMGAMALFGEKYGDRVRVVSLGGDWSRELCAGTHVSNSGEIGRVALLSEASIGSGVRRVEALVADSAYQFQAREHALVSQLSGLLNTRPDELADRVSQLVTKLKESEKLLAQLRQDQLLAQVPHLVSAAQRAGSVRTVLHDAGEVASGDDLRTLALQVRTQLGDGEPSVVAIFGVNQGRPAVVVATNTGARDAGVKAGALVKLAAQALGGGGGGKDDVAQGGGTDPAQIPDALSKIQAALSA